MSFNITTINYPRTLMMGETYDFSKITVETDTAGITIDKIDATWLDVQPPFSEMGYYPLQITATATTGEVATTTVNVFAFEKPHDGFGKFMIFVYKDITRLVSYDCADNPEISKFYNYRTLYLTDITNQNGYIGQQGYNFDETTKQWVFNKDFTGYHDYVFRASGVYLHDLLYCNTDIYAEDKITLIRPADPRKNLPAWDRNVVVRTEVEYSNPLEFDETIEAYYIYQCAHNSGSKKTLAVCFRNLSEPVLDLRLTPIQSDKPRFEHGDSNIEMSVLQLNSAGAWGSYRAWKKQTYAFTTGSLLQDTTLKYITFMNSLQEVHNISFSLCDIAGNYRRSFIMPPKPEQPETPELPETPESPEATKNGRFRMKNEAGDYETYYFETSLDQVVQLPERFDDLTNRLNSQYNKTETTALFDGANQELTMIEDATEALTQRVVSVESDITTFTSALEQETSRATQAENHLQEQLNGIGFDIELINHAETGVLKQAKDYTDELVKNLTDGAIKDLENSLGASNVELSNKIETLTETVATHKAQADVKTSELTTQLDGVESRLTGVEGQVVELGAKDEFLATEISQLKGHLSNKNSNTLVFATYEEFEQAMGSLTPKIGDLVHVLGQKRSYIWTQNNEFVVLDTITNEADLTDYIKRSELELAVQNVETLLTNEVERATLAEQTLNQQIGDLADVVDTHSIRIEGLETEAQTHEIEINGLEESRYTQEEIDRLINDEIERQLPHLGDDEPTKIGLKLCHIWLDTSVE